MNDLTKKIFSPIFEEMNLINNDSCRRCNARYKKPLLPWIIGDGFKQSKYRLMIVGKPHRTEPKCKVSDCAYCMDDRIDDKFINKTRWAYWSYSRQIAQDLYGEGGLDKIVLTNIVKCTNTDGKDTTTKEMMKECVCENGVVWREISKLQPKNILFYTYKLFSEYLEKLPYFNKDNPWKLLEQKRETVICGAKTMPWWERIIKTEWGNVKILVTRHPERMRKVEYVKLITDWVKKGWLQK